MIIRVIGLNHKTAPIDVRERLSLSPAQGDRVLARLQQRYPESEFVLLSTCNRVELYSAGESEDDHDERDFMAPLADAKGLALESFTGHLYCYQDAEAVTHLLKVTAGLDSLVVGESQIMSQVKEAYKRACAAKTTGKILNRLFHCAFATSKEIHTTTEIATGRVSVAGVAVELARQLFVSMTQAKVLVIGAGDMGHLLIKHLLHVGCRQIIVTNRSPCRAQHTAREYGIDAAPWGEWEDRFVEADILIGAAAAEEVLFDKEVVRAMVARRDHKPLLIVDIAVPRNFDPTIDQLEDVHLLSMDDLTSTAMQNRKSRESDIAAGLEIVSDNTAEFMAWFEVRDLGPQIGQLTTALNRIGRKELDHFLIDHADQISDRHQLRPLVNRVVNKILYCFIKQVNETARKCGPFEATRIMDELVRQAQDILSEEYHQTEAPH